MLNFNEDLLQYIWKFQYFNFKDLTSQKGETIQILFQGYQNFDAGPDFSHAKILINDTLWVGQVEIHIKSSDWIKHKHNTDSSYDNVVLHVVYEDDCSIKRKNGDEISTICLKHRIPKKIFDQYYLLQEENQWIPCENLIQNIDKMKIALFMESLAVEKLESRYSQINQVFLKHPNDWDTILFKLICQYFGVRVNISGFTMLSNNISLSLLRKNLHNPTFIEALLFGQSGFLHQNHSDEYPKMLHKEYLFLKAKYKLKKKIPISWKFFRLRPISFPTIRLAQLAQFIIEHPGFLHEFLMADSIKELKRVFSLEPNPYWNEHYVFDKTSTKVVKKPGSLFINTVLINAIIPFLFFYGKNKNIEHIKMRSIRMLMELEPEKNTIIQKWDSVGIKARNALETQSLLHLKKNYCNKFRCLHCTIGHEIMGISKAKENIF